jgi:hypothetical protein
MGCTQGGGDDQPTEAVESFLDAMERSEWDQEALADAYRLLSRPTRQRLRERAVLASALAGREFAPWQMIAQGRFRLRFAPARRGVREHIVGRTATVVVRSAHGDMARLQTVRERGRWRVVLDVPPMVRSPHASRGSDRGAAEARR